MNEVFRYLILMRHGEAQHGGVSDHTRSLTPRGVADTQSIGKKLIETLGHTKIICSDAKRTKQTSEQILKFLTEYAIEFDHDIYLAHDGSRLGKCLVRHAKPKDESIMLIGHNPAISQFAATLMDEPVSFSTSDCLILKSAEFDWSVALQSSGTWQQVKYLSP